MGTSLCGVFVIILMTISPVCSECISDPRKRDAQFEVCPADKVNHYGLIGQQEVVPSSMFCTIKCMDSSTCSSYNTKTADTSISCQLSSASVSCSNLSTETGSRTYVKKQDAVGCANPWRVALKSDLGIESQGSMSNLRDAVLSGSKVNVVIEPYPLPEGTDYHDVWLYVLDTVELTADTAIGHTYSFAPGWIPVWAHVKVNSSGIAEWFLSNGTNWKSQNISITWVVQDVYKTCYLPDSPTDIDPLVAPAVTINGNDERVSEEEQLYVHTLLSQTYLTIRAVRTLADQSVLSFPLYGVMYNNVSRTLRALGTWIPSSSMNLLVLDIDTGLIPVERSAPFDTTFNYFMDDFGDDLNLDRIEFFIDACWTLDYYVNSDMTHYGDVAALIANIEKGAALGIYIENSTHSILLSGGHVSTPWSKKTSVTVVASGLSGDQGASWVDVSVDTSGSMNMSNFSLGAPYTIFYFTDRRTRLYKYSASEGSYDGARARLSAGLMPRVMIGYEAGNTRIYLVIESVEIQYDRVILQSYRIPNYGSYKIFQVNLFQGNLDTAVLVASGKFTNSSTSANYWLEPDAITIFFEESESFNFVE